MVTQIISKRKTYGNTWWGKQWIIALENIDSNRLQRGKSYANAGKVRDIMVIRNTLIAEVRGSYRSYYDTSIQFKHFSNEHLNIFYKIIEDNPSIALDLSLGNLPENLLELLKENGINLLPQSWQEIDAACSCPDEANPCKHLASVYYMIANEIDKDPFVLLTLRGINKQDLLERAGIQPEIVSENKATLVNKLVDYTTIKPVKKQINIDDFTFSFDKFNISQVINLLQPNPSFYTESNFKEVLEFIYKTVSKNADAIWDIKESTSLNKGVEFFIEYSQRSSGKKKQLVKSMFINSPGTQIDQLKSEILKNELDIKQNPSNDFLDYNEDSYLISQKKFLYLPNNDYSEFITRKLDSYKMKLSSGLNYFIDLSIDIDTEYASDSFIFLNVVASLALGLVKSNLYIPEVFYELDIANENFCIRYVPLCNSSIVKQQIDTLCTIMPNNLFQMDKQLLPSEYAADILSLFITFIVNKCLSNNYLTYNNKLLQTFLFGNLYDPKEFSEKNLAKSIDNWLKKLQIKASEVSPLIRFEFAKDLKDNEEDLFQLFVDVHKKESNYPPVEYQNIHSALNKKKDQIVFFDCPTDKLIIEISKQLVIVSEYLPELKDIVDSKGTIIPILKLDQMGKVLSEVSELFTLMGIDIVIPKELKKLAFPQLQLKTKTKIKKTSQSNSFLNLQELLDFSYEISLGDTKINVNDFRKLVKSAKGIVKFKDQYLILNPAEVNNIINGLKEPPPKLSSPMEALFAAVSGEINGLKFETNEVISKILMDLTKVEDIQTPKNLKANLRNYQERGFKWLYSNSAKNLGSCIADDMGLGKTLQIICLILKFKEEKKLKNPAMVICPTTLIANWYKECQKFAPTLNVDIYHGSQRQLITKNKDIIITSYGILRRDLAKFQSKTWDFLIIDEAQNIKNSDTDQTKAVKSVKANNYIAMTGTPVENRLTELWNIFDFTNSGYMGSITDFKNRFSTPIEKYKNKESIELLKKVTSPFMIRRLKTDKSIIDDLPEKIIFDEYCYLSKEQAAVYENIVQETINLIETSKGIERKGLIFKLIVSLKQICNHPANFSKQNTYNSELSGKATKTISVLANILDNKEKALIFTQYKQMGDILKNMIKTELNTEPLFFHGELTRKNRDEMVENFQNNKHNKIMIVSLKAGGTGLNLTSACNVIHYDLWWNPSVENQATDRAFRIGQTKNVMVHRLITVGTFEEKIDEIIKSKKELADLALSTGEQWITELSNKELKEIFTLQKNNF